MQTIAVLLTVFNRKDKTIECLRRLYNQLPIKDYIVDVYLTNDGCTDGTPEAVKQLFPQVHIIDGDGSLFWNRGMYIAWQESSKKNYDFYLWLNDDTFVYPHMLSTLLRDSQNKEHKAIIAGATLSKNHQYSTYGGRFSNGKIPIPQGKLTPIHHFNGNIVLVPRYVFQKLGNLDYYFTHSKGDFDYGYRAGEIDIKMFQSGCYLGECELHESLDKWCNPKYSLKERWKTLHLPNGMPPKETYYFEKRHFGFGKAIFHYYTIYIRCIIPWLWTKFK